LFRRSVTDTFHKISDKYLLLDVAKSYTRPNNRENDDLFGTAINQ
jgi:hypothetical protein